jgi:hypothetical protein
VSSRARHLVAVLLSAVLVSDHGAPEMFGELAFQAPQGLVAGLALGYLPVVVGAAGAAAHPDLGDRSEVECGVELPVTAAG